MLEFFIISVGIAFAIEIVHSILTKGCRFTLEFFGGGFLFGFVREFIYSTFVQTYDFPNMPIKLLSVPIFIPIGWVFTFYLAYEFINKIIEPKTEKDYKNFIIFTAFFSTFICIPIETAAMNMNWWWLKRFLITDNIAPLGLMAGWFYTSVVFFYIYFVLKRKLPREQLSFVVFLLLSIYVVEFMMSGIIGWVLQIIGVLGMLKYNKELTFILVMYAFIGLCSMAFLMVPNGIFVTVLFIFTFIFILVKLHYLNSQKQLNITE